MQKKFRNRNKAFATNILTLRYDLPAVGINRLAGVVLVDLEKAFMNDDAREPLGDSRPTIFRRRAQGLIDLSATTSVPTRDELLKMAVKWRRLADQAERDLLKMMEEPGPK